MTKFKGKAQALTFQAKIFFSKIPKINTLLLMLKKWGKSGHLVNVILYILYFRKLNLDSNTSSQKALITQCFRFWGGVRSSHFFSFLWGGSWGVSPFPAHHKFLFSERTRKKRTEKAESFLELFSFFCEFNVVIYDVFLPFIIKK